MKTIGDVIEMLKGLWELIVEFFNTFLKKEEEETTVESDAA